MEEDCTTFGSYGSEWVHELSGCKHVMLEAKNQPEVGLSQFFGLPGLRGGVILLGDQDRLIMESFGA